MKTKYIKLTAIIIGLAAFSGCADVYDNGSNTPIDYSSEQIKFDNLVTKISFENDVTDSKSNLSSGTATNITYVDGIKGKAYQGNVGSFITYNSVSSKIAGLKSLTISMWIKTAPHASGAQALYALPKSTAGNFWGNNTTFIESTTNTTAMPLKLFFQKTITTPTPSTIDQWIEHITTTTNPPKDHSLYGVYNNWAHIAWTYNGVDSKYHMYVNGQNITQDIMVERKFGANNTAVGFMAFANVQKFIIGGFQQHTGAPFNAPETWMNTYTGAMDEFRIYDAELTATDIFRLYTLEKAGK